MQAVLHKEVVDFCQEIVRIPSLSGEERDAVEAVRRKMIALGYQDVTVDEVGTVAGRIAGSQPGPTVLIDCHVDTVAVTSPERWRHPPFGGVIDGGRLYGRGSSDVKGGLAAAVVAAGRIDRTALGGDLWVAATIGEEVMEGSGQRTVLDRIRPDLVVVGEPTGLRVGHVQKGRASIVVQVRGVPAHTSRPELGVNAVYRMIPIVERLHQLPPLQHPLVGPSVVELIGIGSLPDPPNSIVPDECHARFDCRLVPGETRESFLDRMRAAVAEPDADVFFTPRSMTCYTGVQLEVEDFYPPWSTPTDHPLVTAALDAVAQTGRPPSLVAVPFCTNGSLSAGVRGIPSVVFGPGTVDQAHVIDEYIEVAELCAGADAFQGLVQRLLSPIPV